MHTQMQTIIRKCGHGRVNADMNQNRRQTRRFLCQFVFIKWQT